MKKSLIRKSKYLSLVLRHDPGAVGVAMDKNGWVSVDDLLKKMGDVGRAMSRAELDEIVATNEKRRFAFDDRRERIRASQGHSVDIDLGIATAKPPETLYHGTAERSVEAILSEGLQKGSRQHVHLSEDIRTAMAVGRRHGKPVVFHVASGEMDRQGITFWKSENDVWLTDEVPSEFLGRAIG